MTGNGFTLTVTVAVSIQPLPSVPITVYIVVVAGPAIGEGQLVQLKPVAGDHAYELAPVANSCTESFRQMVLLLPAATSGCVLTVTVTVSCAEQPLLSLPVTMYVVVVAGLAMGLGQLVQLSPVAGVHVKVSAPVASNVTPMPLHIAVSPPAATTGRGLTVTLTVSRAEQLLPLVPVTIYMVVVVGLAVGAAQFVQLSPDAGVQI